MKRKAQALMLLAALGGGCMSTKVDPNTQAHNGVAGTIKAVPNVVGPWGQPVAVRAGEKPSTESRRLNDGGVKQAVATSANNDSAIQQAVGWGAKNGAPPLPQGVPGAVAATGALVGIPNNPYATGRTSVRFVGPAGMQVAWMSGGGFTQTMVEAPGRYNFPQGATYRLKMSYFPGRAGLELYPTLTIVPASSKTATFLAHSAVPINISEEDLEQIGGGNFVVKVIYLPDPAYQDLTAAGPDEIVSSRLEPGIDPIAEAQRRGSVLAILRLGNIDLEAPNTPALDSPPGSPAVGPTRPGMMPPGAIPPGVGRPAAPGPMVK